MASINSDIVLDTEYTKDGILCTHPVMGKIATIIRDYPGHVGWFVFPYRTACCNDGKGFKSLRAAEFYVLALAYERRENSPAPTRSPPVLTA
jgi:hypothetical protein